MRDVAAQQARLELVNREIDRQVKERTAELRQEITERQWADAERQRSENAARESERRLRAIFDNEPECVRVVAPDGRLLDINHSGLAMLEADSREQLADVALLDLVLPEHRQAFYDLHVRVLGGGSGSLEFEMRGLKGTHRWLQTNAVPLRDDAGAVTALLDITRDITERKRAERRLALFARVAANLSAATTREAAGNVIVQAAEELLGWDACFLHLYNATRNEVERIVSRDTVDGRRMDVDWPINDVRPAPMFLRVLREGAQLILRPRMAGDTDRLEAFGDTHRRSASLIFVPIRKAGQTVGVFSIQSYTPNAYTDADLQSLQALADHCAGALERIRVEETLRHSEEHFRSLIENASDVILVVTPEGRAQYASPSVQRVLGHAPAALLGENLLN
jgi:PAS domain S-box-containing protein